jgi:hypothetical protein
MILLSELLARLRRIRGIEIDIIQGDGPAVYIIAADLPFPYARRKVWYPLVIRPGQQSVPHSEIRGLLRRLGHLGNEAFDDLFDDLPEE